MRQFVTEGTGPSQILNEVPNEKIPIYNDIDAVTADLANLEVGQIGATKGTGSELSAPVDTVQSGNMHAVTSNAVAEAISMNDVETEAGCYYEVKRYHKTYYYAKNIVADTQQIIDSDFAIPINKIVNVNAFATNGSLWFKDLNIHFSANNELLIYPKFGGNSFAIIVDVYYIK